MVRVAKYAGFCFGVERAVKTVYETIESNADADIYTLGNIIHNPIVTSELSRRGVRTITVDDIDGICAGAGAERRAVVIVRTHGVTREISEKLAQCEAGNEYFSVVDCTCPYVKKIHNIVCENSTPETATFIYGDDAHPEVEGIKSYAQGEVYTFLHENELRDIIENIGNPSKYTIMVSQTTQNMSEWKNSQELFGKLYTNAKIFDTICTVTENRQRETKLLSGLVDVMIVIGGKNSSNTNKLYDIASRQGVRTVLIETAQEARRIRIKPGENVGITAGASTPDSIIEEVIKLMSNEPEIIEGESFAEMLDESFKTLNTGDVVSGVITSISSNEIHVDLGAKVTGILSLDDITDEPGVRLEELYKVGDTVEAIAVRVSDVDGVATLSKKRIDAKNNWVKIVNAYETGEPLDGKFVEVVKGGVLIYIGGIKAFVPASHTTVPRDGDLSTLLGQTARVRIIEIDEQRRRAKASARLVAREERKAVESEFWAGLEVGKQYTGVVRSLTIYGAFVDLGCGIDGMIHSSELSWKRIKHPSEIVNVGDTITVYVKDVDIERHRISLGYKTEETNPWTMFESTYSTGDTVNVKIVSLMPFGAFAEVIPGVDGLIHISQLSDKRVNTPAEVVSIGQQVDVKITEIDHEKQKISLSMRALIEDAEATENDAEDDGEDRVVYDDSLPVEEISDAPVVEEQSDATAAEEQSDAPVAEEQSDTPAAEEQSNDAPVGEKSDTE